MEVRDSHMPASQVPVVWQTKKRRRRPQDLKISEHRLSSSRSKVQEPGGVAAACVGRSPFSPHMEARNSAQSETAGASNSWPASATDPDIIETIEEREYNAGAETVATAGEGRRVDEQDAEGLVRSLLETYTTLFNLKPTKYKG